MNIKAYKTRLFQEGEDLSSFITAHIKKIPENSVLVVTSKIVALAERRTHPIVTGALKVKLIKRESQFAMKTKYVWLTIKDNMVLASAGIDESNANGKMILLPKDSFKSARVLRRVLMQYYNVKNLGLIISDSRLLPLRKGTVGIVLGYAGFRGLKPYAGTPDLFNRILKFSRVDVADSLATAAVLLMGEGREQQPLALITDAPIDFVDKIRRKELLVDPKEDLYQPLFEKIRNVRIKK
jgi:dihydrofolate synthase / folylpolyglutamate synthase